MGTSMVGENGVCGEYEDDLELNPVLRFAEARERTNVAGCRSWGVTAEAVEEEEEEAELESWGGEG
jgi:hypothetical protein